MSTMEAVIKRPLSGNPSFLVRKYKGKDAAAQFLLQQSPLHNLNSGKECKFVKKEPNAAEGVDVDVGILVDGCGRKGVCVPDAVSSLGGRCISFKRIAPKRFRHLQGDGLFDAVYGNSNNQEPDGICPELFGFCIEEFNQLYKDNGFTGWEPVISELQSETGSSLSECIPQIKSVCDNKELVTTGACSAVWMYGINQCLYLSCFVEVIEGTKTMDDCYCEGYIIDACADLSAPAICDVADCCQRSEGNKRQCIKKFYNNDDVSGVVPEEDNSICPEEFKSCMSAMGNIFFGMNTGVGIVDFDLNNNFDEVDMVFAYMAIGNCIPEFDAVCANKTLMDGCDIIEQNGETVYFINGILPTQVCETQMLSCAVEAFVKEEEEYLSEECYCDLYRSSCKSAANDELGDLYCEVADCCNSGSNISMCFELEDEDDVGIKEEEVRENSTVTNEEDTTSVTGELVSTIVGGGDMESEESTSSLTTLSPSKPPSTLNPTKRPLTDVPVVSPPDRETTLAPVSLNSDTKSPTHAPSLPSSAPIPSVMSSDNMKSTVGRLGIVLLIVVAWMLQG